MRSRFAKRSDGYTNVTAYCLRQYSRSTQAKVVEACVMVFWKSVKLSATELVTRYPVTLTSHKSD